MVLAYPDSIHYNTSYSYSLPKYMSIHKHTSVSVFEFIKDTQNLVLKRKEFQNMVSITWKQN